MKRKYVRVLKDILEIHSLALKDIADDTVDAYRDIMMIFGQAYPLFDHGISLDISIEPKYEFDYLYFVNDMWCDRTGNPIRIVVRITHKNDIEMYRDGGGEIPKKVENEIIECLMKIINRGDEIYSVISERRRRHKEQKLMREFGLAGDESYYNLRGM